MDSRSPAPLRDEDRKPAAFTWGGLLVGTLLLGDGLRRFISPRSERDLYAFFLYIALGFAGLFIAGYRRSFIIDDEGLSRETSLWGKKARRLMLPWEGLAEIRLERDEQQPGAYFAYLGAEKFRWRFRIQDADRAELEAWLLLKRPGEKFDV